MCDNARLEAKWSWFGPVLIAIAGIAAMGMHFWSLGPDAVPGLPRSDFEYYFAPQRAFLSRWLSRGVFPLWNPHLYCGYPVVEITQSALFYPLRWPFLLLEHRAMRGLNIEVFFHLCAGVALSWWMFARALRFSSYAAVAAAFMYAGCGSVLYRVTAGHLTILFAMTWLPVAIISAIPACSSGDNRGPRQRSWWAIAAVGMAMVIVAGSPQYVLYCGSAQFAAVVAVSIRATRREQFANLGRCLCSFFFALAITAPQWMTTLAYIPFAARGAGTYEAGISVNRLTGLAIEFLLPTPLGSDINMFHLQTAASWETMSHPGVAGLLLALCALLRRRRETYESTVLRAGLAIIIAGVSIIIGLPLPGSSLFRNNTRALIVVNLGTATLAGLALQQLSRDGSVAAIASTSSRAAGRFAKIAAINFGVACVLLLGLRLHFGLRPQAGVKLLDTTSELSSNMWPPAVALYESFLENAAPFLDNINRSIVAGAAIAGACAAACCLALRHRSGGVAALSTLIVGTALLPNVEALAPSLTAQQTGWTAELETNLNSLVAQQRAAEDKWRVTLSDALANSAQLIEGLESADGYDPLAPNGGASRRPFAYPNETRQISSQRRYAAEATRWLAEETTSSRNEIWPVMPNRAVRIRPADPNATLVSVSTAFCFRGHDDFSYRASGPLPDNIDFIDSKFRDFVPEALRRAGNAASSRTETQEKTARVNFRESGKPNVLQFSFSISSLVPAFAIVRTTWLPGWEGWVDGRRVALVQANGWMIGVPVSDPGRHDIYLRYRPCFWIPSLILSSLGLLLVIGYWLRVRSMSALK